MLNIGVSADCVDGAPPSISATSTSMRMIVDWDMPVLAEVMRIARCAGVWLKANLADHHMV